MDTVESVSMMPESVPYPELSFTAQLFERSMVPVTHIVPVIVSVELLSTVKFPLIFIGPRLFDEPPKTEKLPSASHIGGVHVPPRAAAFFQSSITPFEIGSSCRGGFSTMQYALGQLDPRIVVLTKRLARPVPDVASPTIMSSIFVVTPPIQTRNARSPSVFIHVALAIDQFDV